MAITYRFKTPEDAARSGDQLGAYLMLMMALGISKLETDAQRAEAAVRLYLYFTAMERWRDAPARDALAIVAALDGVGTNISPMTRPQFLRHFGKWMMREAEMAVGWERAKQAAAVRQEARS